MGRLRALGGRAGGRAARRPTDSRRSRRTTLVVALELVSQRVDVNARAGDGATALEWAVYRENRDAIDLLLRAGAMVNAANDLGVTPLWVAASHANPAIDRATAGRRGGPEPRAGHRRHAADARRAQWRRGLGETAHRPRRRRQCQRRRERTDGVDVGHRPAATGGGGCPARRRGRRARPLEVFTPRRAVVLSDVGRRSRGHRGARSGRADAVAVHGAERRCRLGEAAAGGRCAISTTPPRRARPPWSWRRIVGTAR